MQTTRSTGPATDPTRPPRAASRLTWWPFALAAVVAAAATAWAVRAPAASPTRPAGAGQAAELIIPQDARSVTLLERSVRRAAIARAVISGEVGLLSAAAGYRDLGADDPVAVESLRRVFQGGSDDERYVRAVIRRVRVECELLHVAPAVADRLEAELDRHLTDGSLRLPATTTAAVTPA